MDKKLEEALKTILRQPDQGYIPYAKTYTLTALMNPYTGREMEGEELKVQILYILNNLGTWRGEEARATKAILKEYLK